MNNILKAPYIYYLLGIIAALSVVVVVIFLQGNQSISEEQNISEKHCDPELISSVDEGNPDRYKQRGDKCEGIYVQSVSGTATGLSPIAFTQSFENYDLNSDSPLILKWLNSREEETMHIRIRAQSLKPKVYYRMDTNQNRDNSYEWELDFLKNYEILRNNLSIFAWTLINVNGNEEKVYLPLQIEQLDNRNSDEYLLDILPSADLGKIFFSLDFFDNNKNSISSVKAKEEYDISFPAGQIFPISIFKEDLVKEGIYLAKIEAELANGRPTILDFWFYHSSN